MGKLKGERENKNWVIYYIVFDIWDGMIVGVVVIEENRIK